MTQEAGLPHLRDGVLGVVKVPGLVLVRRVLVVGVARAVRPHSGPGIGAVVLLSTKTHSTHTKQASEHQNEAHL